MNSGLDKLNLRNLSKLYGRSDELAVLVNAYRRVASAETEINCSDNDEKDGTNDTVANKRSTELVLISGYSGTGKSALVQHLRDNHHQKQKQQLTTTSDDAGLFASGKFELLRRSEPYSAIVSAFNDLFSQMTVSLKQRTREAILQTVHGGEGEIQLQTLMSLIPRLGEVLYEEKEGSEHRPSVASSTSVEARNVAFRSLVRALGRVAKPFVLFLDDLQWCDSGSLELMKALLTDNNSRNILYIGTYRDNEVDQNHPLSVRLREVEKESDCIQISKIKLRNLSIDSVNELVSDVLKLEPCDTLSLTEVVHDRTRGNVFFVIQFLENLHDEGLLVFAFSLFRWTWDADRIRADTTVSENVVDLMANKIRKKLSPGERSVLTLAACFGSRFDAHLLELFVTMNTNREVLHNISTDSTREHSKVQEEMVQESEENSGVDTMSMPEMYDGRSLYKDLGVAIGEGLIERDMFVSSSTLYRFSHDRIHQAAYSLIPVGRDRELLHMRIGELILEQQKLALDTSGDSTVPAADWMLFVATDQLNIGRDEYMRGDPGKCVELAKLNLEAGLKAMQSSAFVPAASYLNKGIDLLDKGTQWRAHYDLTLQLYNNSSSAEYRCGHLEESLQRSEEVLTNASCLKDKTGAIFAVSKTLRCLNKNLEALDFCIEALANAGQRLPRHPNVVRVKVELARTRRMMRRMSEEAIVALPTLKDGDESDLAAQLMVPLIITNAHRLFECEITALSACRAVQLILRKGVTYFSPLAFVTFGSVLSREGHYDEGYRCCQVATSLSNRMGLEKSWQPTLTCFMYSYSYHWVKGHHLQDSLDPLLRNYEAGMLSGDIYIAFGSILAYCLTYVYSGLSLAGVESDMRAYCRQMKDYKQEASLVLLAPVWQFVQNLMGSDNPIKLTGEAMNQEDVMEASYEAEDLLPVAIAFFLQLELAYYFSDLELASKLAKIGRIYAERVDPYFFVCRHAFFDGLVSIAAVKKTTIVRRKQVLRPAKEAVKRMKKWVECGNGNALHMLSLLVAEFDSLSKRCTKEEIKKSYDEAISISGRNGFVQDKALACERAAIFYLESNDKDSQYWASQYMSQAHQLYLDWGAKAKADHLMEEYGSSVITTEDYQNNGPGHRSRSRFTDGTKSHRRLDYYSTGLGPDVAN